MLTLKMKKLNIEEKENKTEKAEETNENKKEDDNLDVKKVEIDIEEEQE